MFVPSTRKCFIFTMMTSSNGNILRVTGHLWGSPVNSPHKGQWRRALMFSLICVWINSWVNYREAGDLRRYPAHFDVTVMTQTIQCAKWPVHGARNWRKRQRAAWVTSCEKLYNGQEYNTHAPVSVCCLTRSLWLETVWWQFDRGIFFSNFMIKIHQRVFLAYRVNMFGGFAQESLRGDVHTMTWWLKLTCPYIIFCLYPQVLQY